jgi:type IV secretory pathway TraG/TraD family ATPase VirD4
MAYTRPLDSRALREMLNASDFALRDLHSGGMTVYLLQSQPRSAHEWLARLLKNQAAIAAAGIDARHRTLVIGEETYCLGRFGVTTKDEGIFGVNRDLRKYRGSILCLDADAETVLATAARRRALGQRVHILDPMGVLDGVE